MQWTKIPTNILINRYTDQEIVSIVKYQLLWADLEYQPEDKTALRYLTHKQLKIVRQYLNSIEAQVTRDIRSSESNRNNRKLNYLKNKEKIENVTHTLQHTVSSSVGEQIRLDKIILDKEIYKESFEEFWKLFPKQRAGNKKKAYTAYCRAIKEKRTTEESILEAVKLYSGSEEVRRGFAKGCAAWINDDRFNNQYKKQEWMI